MEIILVRLLALSIITLIFISIPFILIYLVILIIDINGEIDRISTKMKEQLKKDLKEENNT